MSQEVVNEVIELLRGVLQHEGELTAEMTREDIPKWESIKHVQVIDVLEQEYNIQLSMDEIMEIQSVQDIVNVLDRHGAI
jgi:acyl carrier protein